VLSIGKVSWGGEHYYIDAVLSLERDMRAMAGFEPELGEPPGVWVGRGSNSIGLGGIVYPETLTALLAGKDPFSQQGLGRKDDRIKVAAFDLTFNAPKSVSILYGLLEPRLGAEVRNSHEAAVRGALGYLERNAIGVRRTIEGTRMTLPTSGAPAAGFLHRTSRALDPHLHTHVVMANLARGEDGSWSGIDGRGLYYHAKTASFLYQAELRRQMSTSLGVEWGTVRNGWADVLGVSREVVRGFSTRLLQIEADLERLGMSSPHAAHIAALKTRQPKEIHCAMSDLRRQWQKRALELGLGPLQLEKVLDRKVLGIEHGHLAQGASNRLAGGWGEVALSIHDKKAFCLDVLVELAKKELVTRREVIQACCQALSGGGSARAIESLSEEVMHSGIRRSLGVDIREERFRVVDMQLPDKMYSLEREVGRWLGADRSRVRVDPVLDGHQLSKEMPGRSVDLGIDLS